MAVFHAPLAARSVRVFLTWLAAFLVSLQMAAAAPFASLVMDARTGEVLQATNADTRLHPASLTKMMTLYIAFDAIRRGEISLDTEVTITSHAANEPPSKLGLRSGQRIKLRYLIRAAAIKSANDAATAIGEGISGSESAFAARMTQMARRLGMNGTTFKNAHGLTESGHLSTARDMTVLGRHLIYDFPEYYNLFSRESADAGISKVTSHNRILKNYPGADGIKTGYTVAAGFNLVASAKRGNERIIATVFGGASTPARDAKVAELLDLGFKRAPSTAKLQPPTKAPAPVDDPMLASGGTAAGPGTSAKTIRVSGAVGSSPRPKWRPGAVEPAPSEDLIAAIEDGVSDVLDTVAQEEEALEPTDTAPVATIAAPPRPDRSSAALRLMQGDPLLAVLEAADDPAAKLAAEAEIAAAEAPVVAAEGTEAVDAETPEAVVAEASDTVLPEAPETVVAEAPETIAADAPALVVAEAADEAVDPAPAEIIASFTPPPEVPEAAEDLVLDGDDELASLAEAEEPAPDLSRDPVIPAADPAQRAAAAEPAPTLIAAIEPETFDAPASDPVVLTRLSTSGGKGWGVNVGKYGSQYEAERVLMKTALTESRTLDSALRKVVKTKTGFDANFAGMTEDMARLACRRLVARNISCTTLGPG